VLKYLRIAVTALSLTACVLLIALWVRSYWWWDSVSLNHLVFWSADIESSRGGITASAGEDRDFPWTYDRHTYRAAGLNQTFEISVMITGQGARLAVPYWILICTLIPIATIPWLHWSRRFSLRTLLIATTVVAVALGIFAVSS
jgi:hypothetical protein